MKRNPRNTEMKEKIKFVQHQRNILLTEKTAKNLKFVKQIFFENTNKLRRWFAYKLRKEKEKTIITNIER